MLSALGGELADKYVKSVVARRLKFCEIFAACFAAAGFFLHSVPLLFVALALFGTVAALFRPGEVRHPARSIVDRRTRDGQRAGRGRDIHGDPDRHHRRRPVRLGVVAYGLDLARGGRPLGAVLGVCLADPGTMPSAPDLAITRNPWTSTVRLLKTLYAEPRLWDGMVIVSWFWLVGAVVLSLLPP